MGMFDWIDYEGYCPNCKSKLDAFQSKSGPCMEEWLKPYEVNMFYAHCIACGAWVTGSASMPDIDILGAIGVLQKKIDELWEKHSIITLKHERL